MNNVTQPAIDLGPQHLDENGADCHYADWLWGCRVENQSGIASNGQRVTTALALQIAHEVLRALDPVTPHAPSHMWNDRDLMLARAALSGLRAQAGCEHLDPAVRDGYLTHYCDIAIYG